LLAGQVHPAVADLSAVEVHLYPEPEAVLAHHGRLLDAAYGPETVLELPPEQALFGRLELHPLLSLVYKGYTDAGPPMIATHCPFCGAKLEK
jgi:hypothetical protein